MVHRIPAQLAPVSVATLLLLAAVPAAAQGVVITGIFDGPITGGIPKFVELYAVTAVADLSAYGLESANNGAAPVGREYTLPAGAAGAGTFLWIATESVAFSTYFGFAPTDTDLVASINGDDAIVLYFDNGSTDDPVDHYGVPGVDGTGEVWEYTDGWAYRTPGTGPDIPFVPANWSFSGINATDGCSANASCNSVYPIGTYPVELTGFTVE